MINKKYDSPVAQIICDENDIFICKLKESKAEYNAEEIRNQFNFFIKHSKGKSYKVILDTANSLNFPTDGFFDYFFENNQSENRIAIVTHALPMRLLIEQTFHYNKVENTYFFRTIEEAYEWIINQ